MEAGLQEIMDDFTIKTGRSAVNTPPKLPPTKISAISAISA